jgi:5-methylcytosine-specific restriction endonuclease McrA
MTLSKLDDGDLIKHTVTLAKEERSLLIEVLHCLREIERRKLASSLGFQSLFDFAVRKLGYSEDQAYRRIQAMQLIRKVPEIEPMVQSGSLTLTGIGLAQSHIKREEKFALKPFTPAETLSIIQVVAGKPTREAEKALLGKSRFESPPRLDVVKPISPGYIELRLTITEDTWKKISSLKGSVAHRLPNPTLGELVGIICDIAVDKSSTYSHAAPRAASRKSPLHRQVFLRDGNKCQNCGSQHALEVDHIQPKALGGENTLENLRLLCRNCNQRKAIEAYGLIKMEKYL